MPSNVYAGLMSSQETLRAVLPSADIDDSVPYDMLRFIIDTLPQEGYYTPLVTEEDVLLFRAIIKGLAYAHIDEIMNAIEEFQDYIWNSRPIVFMPPLSPRDILSIEMIPAFGY